MRFMLEFNRNGRYALTLSALDKKGNSKVLGIAGQGEWTFLPSIALQHKTELLRSLEDASITLEYASGSDRVLIRRVKADELEVQFQGEVYTLRR